MRQTSIYLLSVTLRGIAALMLLLSFSKHGHDYFFALRVVTCATAAFIAVLSAKRSPGWTAAFVVIAILFNPIVEFYLRRDLWQVIDICTAGVFVASVYMRVGLGSGSTEVTTG